MTNEEIFNNNINIAYKIANQYLSNYADEIEDIRQIALMELWRCIETWDHIHALTTYAYFCIPRKINMYLRHVRKHKNNDISINMIIAESNDNHGIDLTLEDLIPDPVDHIDDAISQAHVDTVMNRMYFTNKEKEIIKYKKKKLVQIEIGKRMGLSQAQISRLQKHMRDKIRKELYA